jgi:uncharacterized protein YciI
VVAIRAASLAEAEAIAKEDPMHASGRYRSPHYRSAAVEALNYSSGGEISDL